jgi:hypothetical protein
MVGDKTVGIIKDGQSLIVAKGIEDEGKDRVKK